MAQTPNEAKNKAVKQDGATEITLSNGKTAVCRPAKGKDVMKAQRLMDGDAEKMLPALISVCTTIDGQMLTIEEQEEMPAGDFMKVMGHFGTAFQ